MIKAQKIPPVVEYCGFFPSLKVGDMFRILGNTLEKTGDSSASHGTDKYTYEWVKSELRKCAD